MEREVTFAAYAPSSKHSEKQCRDPIWIFKKIFILFFMCINVCLYVCTTCLPDARRSKKRVLDQQIGELIKKDGIMIYSSGNIKLRDRIWRWPSQWPESWDDRASQGQRQVAHMQAYGFWFVPLPIASVGFELGVSTLSTLSNHLPKTPPPLSLLLFFFQNHTFYKASKSL